MLRRMTSGWTDLHLPLVSAALVAGTISWSAAGLEGLAGPGVVAVVATVALLALLADAFFGIAVGLLGAAVTVFVVTSTQPHRSLAEAAVHAATAVLVLVLGALAGGIGDGIRRGRRRAGRIAAGAVAPVPGSLGLMSAADAHLRLEEEIVRARLHDRPLALAVVNVTLREEISAENARRARRAVARVLDTELRSTDIPFAVDSEGEFGVILVETPAETAGDVLESALILARDATFADRETGERRYVGDVAFVLLGVTEISHRTRSTASALAATRDELVELPAWSEV